MTEQKLPRFRAAFVGPIVGDWVVLDNDQVIAIFRGPNDEKLAKECAKWLNKKK